MFERFTDRSRRVVVLAQEEARVLKHNHVGPEHILLGLVHEGHGVAAKALEELGVRPEALREQIEELIGTGQQEMSGHIPFTPRAKRVLELSLREALQLGHNYIGTEHILLGILREGDNVAAQVLVRMGVDLNRVRLEVVRLVGSGSETGTRLAAGETRAPGSVTSRDPLLAEVRNALVAMSERLTAIERHLGLSAAAGAGRPDDATGGEPEESVAGQPEPPEPVPGEPEDSPGGERDDESADPPGDVTPSGG